MNNDDLTGRVVGLTDLVLVLAKVLESQPTSRAMLYSQINETAELASKTPNLPARSEILREFQAHLCLLP